MRTFLLIISLLLSLSVKAELNTDPEHNGAKEILEKTISVLPKEKKDKVNLAFISKGADGKGIAQSLYEKLETGQVKGVLAIGGPDNEVTDKVIRTITTYLSQDLSEVTLVIFGNKDTEAAVSNKLSSLGAKVYYVVK